MFDRQRSSAAVPEARMAVTLTMNDGEVMRGNLRLPLSGKLFDAMNNADLFFDFETQEGERLFLAKHGIRKVQAVEIPRADQLAKRNADKGIFDPYAVLGVAPGADPQALKQAYLALARLYHPDRFAGIELPREMRDYANAMLTRINVAYQQLNP